MIVSGYQTYLIRSNNVVSERAFVSAGFSAGPTAYDATPKTFTVQSVMDALTQGAEGISSVNFVANLTNNGNTGIERPYIPPRNALLPLRCCRTPGRFSIRE